MSPTTTTPLSVHGIDALRLDGEGLSVTVTTGMGPRILAFGVTGRPNLLVEQPDATIEVPGLPRYRMLGGHRLWHTPEVPATTYRPDESPVTVTPFDGGVDLLGADDPIQGVRKRLRVTLTQGGLQVAHEVRNTSAVPLTTAAWAITQVPPRGEAWIPLTEGELQGSYLPNRAIVLWPYSSLADPRLSLEDGLAIVRGVAGSPGRVKVGTQRERGWIAWRDGATVLSIRAAQEPGTYGDMGAGTQCYSCGDFVELETISPATLLEPGAAVEHRQTWQIASVDPAAGRDEVLVQLGLTAR